MANGNKRRLKVLLHMGDRWCAYCGAEVTLRMPLPEGMRQATLDHIRPRCDGGSHSFANSAVACLECNNAKGNDSLLLFLLERQEAAC